jgi:two-component system, chemotaxis family, protein-glutamate methylesterase/glutaminase
MKKAKVLIVDDSMLIRRLVADALANDVAVDVVGEAANGRIGLQKIAQLSPDLVTLDIEMPEMDGLATLREIRKTHPRLPVIMFSSTTERGAAATLEALHLGASDYVTKPNSAAGKALAQQRIQESLMPKIRALCRVGVAAMSAAASRSATSPTSPTPFTMRALGTAPRADIVAVALSTGGPSALGSVLAELPADFPAPIVLVQHMPSTFTRLLAERLNNQTALTVIEATDGQVLAPGTVYVAPGDFHLAVRKGSNQIVTALTDDPPEHSHRPAADVLFRSVANVYGSRALAIVLTGMGEDGLSGSREITRAGGRVIVQDEATSVVWEMPGRIAQAGIADGVLPIGAMAAELIRRTKRAA